MRSEKKTRAAGAEWSGGVSVWAVKVCGSAASALGFVSHASSRICSSAAAIVLFAVCGRGGSLAVRVTVLAIVLRVFPRPSPTSTAMQCGGAVRSCVGG